MPFKFFSALAIIASCFYIGREMAENLKQRASLLEAFICAIAMSEDFISALSMPLCDIYRNLSEHIKPLGTFFLQLCDSQQSPYYAWKSVLKSINHLTDSDKKILLSMAKTLGACDAATQLNSLELTKKRLQENLNDAREKIKSDARMYKSVSLFTGIGIAVLLI